MKTVDAKNALNNINEYFELRREKLTHKTFGYEPIPKNDEYKSPDIFESDKCKDFLEREKKEEKKLEEGRKASEIKKNMKQANEKWHKFIYNRDYCLCKGNPIEDREIFDCVRWMLQYLHPGETITYNICISEMDKLIKFCENGDKVIHKTEFLKYFEKKVLELEK